MENKNVEVQSKTKKQKKKMKPYDPNKKTVFKEFKAFLSRGNVVDMAVGVIIGGAFSAIVTAVSQILLSVCTWWVPGGINGLVTLLPAISSTQKGLYPDIGIGQSFSKTELGTKAQDLLSSGFESFGGIDAARNRIIGAYTLYGNTYYYNNSALINWGSVINAVIAFLIIGLTLFIIVKIIKYITAKRDEEKAKMLEAYYKKYPELRPAPAGPKEPTDHEILKEILRVLKEQKVGKND